jgi:hypothetical protein
VAAPCTKCGGALFKDIETMANWSSPSIEPSATSAAGTARSISQSSLRKRGATASRTCRA